MVAPRLSHVWATWARSLSIASLAAARLTGSRPVASCGWHGMTPMTGVGAEPLRSASELTRLLIVSNATTPSATIA